MVAALRLRSGPVLIGMVLMVILVGMSLTQPNLFQVKADWTYPSGYNPHGGYMDRLIFMVYPSEDIAQALLALQAGDVYSYDEHIPHQAIAEVQANPAIEVTSELGELYRQFTLNCQRFPTNLTGYRRALAYALDKYTVIAIARGGYAEPMDNAIPMCFDFWTYENQMASHFYLEDIVSANATLDAAHIIDPEGDPNHPHPGWRFYDADMSGNWTAGDKRGDIAAPEGMKIDIWSSYYGPAMYPPFSLVYGMEKCGLYAEVVEVDYTTLINGLTSGEYSIGCFAWHIDSPGTPSLLHDMFHSEGQHFNFFYRFNNTEYDYNCTQFMNASTRIEARNWAWNCCRILIEEMPMIVCYNDEYTHAVRTDIWEGYINQVGVNRMGGNPYTYQQIHLKPDMGGPFGCYPTEYVTVLSEGMDFTNTILSDSKYTQTIFNLIYSKLWQIDPLDPSTELAPDLAYDWTLTPTTASGDIQEGMKYTFRLYENVTWHDGTPFTAEDVQYSFLNIHPRGTYTAAKVTNIYRVDTPDNHTVEIYSNETGYATFIEATNVQILPKHIWSPYEAENFTWTPRSIEDLTGSGCYRWVSHEPGQYIILDRFEDWHFAMAHPPRTPCPLEWPVYIFGLLLFFGVMIILIQICILAYFLFRRRYKQAKKGEKVE